MKLLRYGPKGQEKPGLLDADGRARSLVGVVDDIDAPLLASGFAELRGVDPAGLPRVDPSERLGPPLASIGKFICIGLNYRDHAEEAGMPIPAEPIIFMKATSAVIGPNDDVVLPPTSDKADWEVELGVVIGQECRYVAKDRRARPHRGLLRRQRPLRTRISARTRRPMGQGQGLRHLRADRPLAGHAG